MLPTEESGYEEDRDKWRAETQNKKCTNVYNILIKCELGQRGNPHVFGDW